jgi:hypothetical protein
MGRSKLPPFGTDGIAAEDEANSAPSDTAVATASERVSGADGELSSDTGGGERNNFGA